jgi:hypothetical protein
VFTPSVSTARRTKRWTGSRRNFGASNSLVPVLQRRLWRSRLAER